MARSPDLHRGRAALPGQCAAGLHRPGAPGHGSGQIRRRARTQRGPGPDGFPLLPAKPERALRERPGQVLEHAPVQAPAPGGRQGLARPGRRARRLPGRRGAWGDGAVQPQAGHRPHRLDLDHLRRDFGRHRADPGQYLYAQDPVRLVRRQKPLSGEAARRQGAEHRGGVAHDSGERRLDPAPGRPDTRREGCVQDRLRTRPALGYRTGRRPHARGLPVSVPQRLPARRRG